LDGWAGIVGLKYETSVLHQGVAFFAPAANAAVHGNHVGVAHFLQIIGSESRAKPSPAIENHLRAEIGNASLNVAFNDPLAQVHGAGKMVLGKLALFAYIDEQKAVTAIHTGFHCVNVGLANARPGIVDDLQKPGWVLSHSKEFTRIANEEERAPAVRSSAATHRSSSMESVRDRGNRSRKRAGHGHDGPRTNPRSVGLARALSKLGYCSRSQAAEWIRDGRVSLNGSLRREPETPVRLGRDRITLSGHDVEAAPKAYFVMNKPRGLVTTASDEKGRETVYSILAHSRETLPWIAPVGRLDKASEGLLLWTNDSEWAARVTAPETCLEKTYHVQIDAVADQELLERMVRGVNSEGELLRASNCRLLRAGAKNCWLEITLREGRNRQIRRLAEAMGVAVLRLVRVAIGPLPLGTLAKGSYRRLEEREKRALDSAMEAGGIQNHNARRAPDGSRPKKASKDRS
jgi:23S rRNA pseudouridine2605 synthase